MEADRQADEILLNALVDGELHPADQARAAARLRADKDFARAYATLSRLKAGVAELAETEAAAITLRHPATRRWLPYAVAASLALLTAVAGLAVLLPIQTVKQAAAPTPVIPVGFAGEAVIPDLSAAGLQLARTIVSASSGVPSLVATYRGPRGCRLELWIRNGAEPAAVSSATGRHEWQVDRLRYALVAFGMPAARFVKVAALAEQQTRAIELPDGTDPLVQAQVPHLPCIT